MKVGDRSIDAENKALVLLTAKTSGKERLIEECQRIAGRLMSRMGSPAQSVAVMARVDGDPFRLVSKAPGYDVTVELRATAGHAGFVAALEGFSRSLPSTLWDASASVVLVGTDYLFRPCPREPVRFQYAMRRRADLSHGAFARHYAEIHSGFGYKTRGVRGYAQFHVDPAATSQAQRLSGLGAREFDGVSQLDLTSLARFLLASPINGAMGAVTDEKRFVDRESSAMFSSKVVACLDNGSWPLALT